MKLLIAIALLFVTGALAAQEPSPSLRPRPVPVPMPKPNAPVAEPTDPPAQTVEDARTHISFRLPAGWNLSRRDGELSTFRLDARSAPVSSHLRAVATIAFNPYPLSTFASALFYLSVTPHSTMAACAAQTSALPNHPLPPATLADVAFARGHDEHGKICTDARDIAYTTLRRGSCIRFDLAVNTFCGGEVSGIKDITDQELASVFQRMVGILDTVRFLP